MPGRLVGDSRTFQNDEEVTCRSSTDTAILKLSAGIYGVSGATVSTHRSSHLRAGALESRWDRLGPA